MRRIIAGNWKMNPTTAENAVNLAKGVDERLEGINDLEKIIFPPFVYIPLIMENVRSVEIGAQNVFYELSGAYTGEVSPSMLLDLGVKWVIIGHSERRNILHEDDESIIRKVKSSLEVGLKVILCVGEKLHERELFRHKEVVKRQLDGIPDDENLVIAYEPVWAIGTGRNARVEQIEEMHEMIKSITGKKVLYGGSVKPENASELASAKNVDGFLVGGASLEADSFHKIALALRNQYLTSSK